MTQRIRIGIVSGCIGAPMASVGKSALFHQVAARHLVERGIELRVSLRPIDAFWLDHMLAHLQFLVDEKGCDLVAFQIRPSLLRQAAVVVWKDRRRYGPARIRPSPYYRHDLNDFSPPPTLTPTTRFHRLDHALARLTGLQHRAAMQVSYQLEAIAHAAREHLRRPLVFLGPVFNATLPAPLDAYWTPIVRGLASRVGVPLVDLCDFRLAHTPELFEPDQFHVSPRGHEMIGRRLAEHVAGSLISR